MKFQNDELRALSSERYSDSDVRRIETVLRSHGTLTFDSFPTGLFPACRFGAGDAQSGYDNVWVRDNVYVAYAHLVAGEPDIAEGVARGLLRFYALHRRRFDDVSSRPHVRFDGRELKEIGDWAHAQNDALGYLMWLCGQLIRNGRLADDESRSTLALIPRYLHAIRYWEDEDSGHWEETRKISASSIGAVVAGLESLQLDAERGRAALAAILPNECVQLDPGKNRRYDAAHVFLLFPLGIIDDAHADLLLHDVDRYLAGEIGIRRYLRDSFWAPDYDRYLAQADRTRDFSRDIATRDALLRDVGGEAQWCLFDPLLSAYYGKRGDRERQVHHFNRALAQVTATWQCPELYYLKDGRYTPGPQSPLQWTQANLLIALRAMEGRSDGAR